jgi:hypothetical protein
MTLQAMAKHIELWLLDKLIPYAKNARTHSEAQIAQIAASIKSFGFNNPILVDSKAGIIAGHGRLLAARQLGLEEVPVIVLDHLTETQKRAYVIADNQLALNAGWDTELLGLELAALRDEDFDVDLIGFEDDELARLLAAEDVAEVSLTKMQSRTFLNRRPPRLEICGCWVNIGCYAATRRFLPMSSVWRLAKPATLFLRIRPTTSITRDTPKTGSRSSVTR